MSSTAQLLAQIVELNAQLAEERERAKSLNLMLVAQREALKSSTPINNAGSTNVTNPHEEENVPEWLRSLFKDKKRRVWLREWEDVLWRQEHGWKGNDLCHNMASKAVRILAYFYDNSTSSLIGVVHFGPDAESHRGLCHGGAMTSAMDDALGHIAFFAGGSLPLPSFPPVTRDLLASVVLHCAKNPPPLALYATRASQNPTPSQCLCLLLSSASATKRKASLSPFPPTHKAHFSIYLSLSPLVISLPYCPYFFLASCSQPGD